MKNEEVISTLEFLKIAARIDAKPVNVNTEALDIAIDAVKQPKIIYCKDCKYQKKYWHEDRRMKDKGYWIYGCELIDDPFIGVPVYGVPDQFCSSAEPKEKEQ